MSNPRITVGVPVYNSVQHIAKALDCLQRQTFKHFEVIISVDLCLELGADIVTYRPVPSQRSVPIRPVHD